MALDGGLKDNRYNCLKGEIRGSCHCTKFACYARVKDRAMTFESELREGRGGKHDGKAAHFAILTAIKLETSCEASVSIILDCSTSTVNFQFAFVLYTKDVPPPLSLSRATPLMKRNIISRSLSIRYLCARFFYFSSVFFYFTKHTARTYDPTAISLL